MSWPLSLQILSHLYLLYGGASSSPLHSALSSGSLAAAVCQMAQHDLSSSVILALLELCITTRPNLAGAPGIPGTGKILLSLLSQSYPHSGSQTFSASSLSPCALNFTGVHSSPLIVAECVLPFSLSLFHRVYLQLHCVPVSVAAVAQCSSRSPLHHLPAGHLHPPPHPLTRPRGGLLPRLGQPVPMATDTL